MNGPNDDAAQYEFSADEERQQRADRAAMLSKTPKPYSMLTKQRGPGFPSGAPKPYSWLGGVGKDIAAKD